MQNDGTPKYHPFITIYLLPLNSKASSKIPELSNLVSTGKHSSLVVICKSYRCYWFNVKMLSWRGKVSADFWRTRPGYCYLPAVRAFTDLNQGPEVFRLVRLLGAQCLREHQPCVKQHLQGAEQMQLFLHSSGSSFSSLIHQVQAPAM